MSSSKQFFDSIQIVQERVLRIDQEVMLLGDFGQRMKISPHALVDLPGCIRGFFSALGSLLKPASDDIFIGSTFEKNHRDFQTNGLFSRFV